MKLWMILVAVGVGVALGVTGVVVGGADDSPGAQGLGLLVALGSIALGVRAVRRRR